MFTTPEQFAAANKATVDSLLSLANTALASAGAHRRPEPATPPAP